MVYSKILVRISCYMYNKNKSEEIIGQAELIERIGKMTIQTMRATKKYGIMK